MIFGIAVGLNDSLTKSALGWSGNDSNINGRTSNDTSKLYRQACRRYPLRRNITGRCVGGAAVVAESMVVDVSGIGRKPVDHSGGQAHLLKRPAALQAGVV